MDLNDLISHYHAKERGIAFMIIPISTTLLDDFPVPRTEIVEEFLNFSDDALSEHADGRTFDPRRHLFHVTASNTLLMGMVGRSPQIYEWAHDWLTGLQAEPRWAGPLAHARLLTASDLLVQEESEPETPSDDLFHGTPLAYTDDELEANEKDTGL